MAKVPKWANVTSISDIGKDHEQSTETAQDILEKLAVAKQQKAAELQDGEGAVENNYQPSERGMAILRAFVERWGQWAGAEVLNAVTGFDKEFCQAFVAQAFPSEPFFKELPFDELLYPLLPDCLIKDGRVVIVSESTAIPVLPVDAGHIMRASPDATQYKDVLVNKSAKDLDTFYVCVVDDPVDHCATWALDAHTYVALKISGKD